MNIKRYARTVHCKQPSVLPKLNRTALAKSIGLSRVCVSRVLSGYGKPRMEAASKIAKALGMSMDELFKLLEKIKAARLKGYRNP
jgi:DNA-binding XRE family transcriptional regulator